MKTLKTLSFALAALALPLAAGAAPEPTIDAQITEFRAILAKGLREVYVQELKLTDAEGKAFWPVYDAYAAGVKAHNDKVLALIKRYAAAYNAGPVDEATAKSLLSDAMALDKSEAKLRDDVMSKAMKALPATKAAVFYQIDSKVRATFKYDLAAQIPLVE
jgi:Spy/CpxP family protein refolding chaperone